MTLTRRTAVKAAGVAQTRRARRWFWQPLVALLLAAAGALPVGAQNGLLVYFGTYTGGKSKGIYVSRFNPATGELSAPQLAAATPSPSFLALRTQGDFLYAVNEVDTFGEQPGGSV